MKWKTRSYLHLDRTASAWLVRRFVDPAAEFEFVGWDVVADTSDERVFGVPGARLAPQPDGTTGFAAILAAEGLDQDAALVALERAIAAGVRHALNRPTPADQTPQETAFGQTLDACGVAWSVLHSDLDHLAAATPIYDALYTYFQFGDFAKLELPPTQQERVTMLRELHASAL